MRRSQPRNANQTLVVAPYQFDLARKVLSIDGAVVEMTDKEFELAAFLFRNLGRLLSRGHLLEAVWGRNPDLATRTVDTHISRVRSKLNLRPGAIIDALDLRRPIYRKTAAYGHFGRELPEFTWERTDKADELRKACGLA